MRARLFSPAAALAMIAALGAGGSLVDADPQTQSVPRKSAVSAPIPSQTGPVIRYAPPTAKMIEEAARRASSSPRVPFLPCRKRLYNRRVVKTFGGGATHRMKPPFA